MRIRATVLTTLLVAALLAGCISSEEPVDPAEGEPLPDQAGEAQATAETGALRGTVGSDLFEPLAGATVTIIETIGTDDPKETKTAKDGSFTINDIEPGRYTVWATAPDYESNRLPVNIVAGEVASIQFLLPVLPCADCPYEDIREYAGSISYAVAWQLEGPAGCIIMDLPLRDVKTCSGVRGGGSEHGEVKIEVPERSETVFAAMVWQPAGPLGEHLMMDLLCPSVPRGNGGAVLDTEHDCYWEPQQTKSPIIHRVDRAHWEEKGYNHTGNWSARVFASHGMLGTYDLTKVDAGVAYEQVFRIYTEVWVNHAAPADHQPVPDA